MELSCDHTNKHNWWTLDHFSVLHDKDPVLQRLLVELPSAVCSDASYKVCIKTISEKWDICVTISVCVESGEEPSLLCYLTSSDPSLGEPVHWSTLVTNLMYMYISLNPIISHVLPEKRQHNRRAHAQESRTEVIRSQQRHKTSVDPDTESDSRLHSPNIKTRDRHKSTQQEIQTWSDHTETETSCQDPVSKDNWPDPDKTHSHNAASVG